jgi:hypothetical protein
VLAGLVVYAVNVVEGSRYRGGIDARFPRNVFDRDWHEIIAIVPDYPHRNMLCQTQHDRLAANLDAGGGREVKRFLRIMSALYAGKSEGGLTEEFS